VLWIIFYCRLLVQMKSNLQIETTVKPTSKLTGIILPILFWINFCHIHFFSKFTLENEELGRLPGFLSSAGYRSGMPDRLTFSSDRGGHYRGDTSPNILVPPDWPPDQGLCPWNLLEAPPTDPRPPTIQKKSPLLSSGQLALFLRDTPVTFR